jgi:uncharacterized protein
MRYNVAQLLKGPTGAQRRYALDEDIGSLDQELEPIRPLEGQVTLIRTSQGILAMGKLRTAIQVTCRRCLESCTMDVEFDLEEEFYPVVRIGEAPMDDVPEIDLDDALLIDEHHILDLRQVVRQGLWLAGPAEALCRPDCSGLCPRCGGNRNLGECRCEETAIDPRWAALQAFLSKELQSEERSD